ncbi:ParB/RepB/Spo0J family partition protein [Microcoleus sp. B7-D4]
MYINKDIDKRAFTVRAKLVPGKTGKSCSVQYDLLSPSIMELKASSTIVMAPKSVSIVKMQRDSQTIQAIGNCSSVFKTLRLEQISASKYPVWNYFDEGIRVKLIASVKEHGIITPILVRPGGENHY